MGRPGMAEKMENQVTHRGGRRRVRRPDLGVSGVVWPGNFTDEVASPSFSSLANTCARGGGGGCGNRLTRPKPFGLKTAQNDRIRG